MDQVSRARLFRQMHLGPGILVIANAWDAASARVFEEAGVRAIGTSSAGIAFSHGYPDNEFLPRDVLLRATEEITRSVHLPVTADILTGLGASSREIAATVKEVIALGAVGINIEDGTEQGGFRLFDIEEQADKIAAVCAAVAETDVPIVVNARTDSFWLKLGDEKSMTAESVKRANRYRAAGADCLFVPSAAERATIKTLVDEIDGPVNILTVPGCPPIAELEALGVRRASEGSGPMRASMAVARRVAAELLATGTYAAFHQDAIPYAEANRLFSR